MEEIHANKELPIADCRLTIGSQEDNPQISQTTQIQDSTIDFSYVPIVSL